MEVKASAKHNRIVIGIDQSYQDTGLSISYDNELFGAAHIRLSGLKNNTEKRNALKKWLHEIFSGISNIRSGCDPDIMDMEVIVIIERIRLRSQGNINMNYIKSIGALNSLIVDAAASYGFPVYSVDTRSWKSRITGSSKPCENKYGISPEKWGTILWCISHGYKDMIIDYETGNRKKGIIRDDRRAYTYNDNVADSICISLYGFVENPLLVEEK